MANFQGWVLSLSDGRTILEGEAKDGDPSPWQQIIGYLNETGLKATACGLVWNGHKISAVPKAEGYFQAYEARMSLLGGEKTRKTSRGIGTVVGDQIFITWISEIGEIYQEIRPLEDNIVHTTLRD